MLWKSIMIERLADKRERLNVFKNQISYLCTVTEIVCKWSVNIISNDRQVTILPWNLENEIHEYVCKCQFRLWFEIDENQH